MQAPLLYLLVHVLESILRSCTYFTTTRRLCESHCDLQAVPPQQRLLSYLGAVDGKDVITQSGGERLGSAAQVVVDKSAMTLEAIVLKKKDMPGKDMRECVPLGELVQVRQRSTFDDVHAILLCSSCDVVCSMLVCSTCLRSSKIAWVRAIMQARVISSQLSALHLSVIWKRGCGLWETCCPNKMWNSRQSVKTL